MRSGSKQRGTNLSENGEHPHGDWQVGEGFVRFLCWWWASLKIAARTRLATCDLAIRPMAVLGFRHTPRGVNEGEPSCCAKTDFFPGGRNYGGSDALLPPGIPQPPHVARGEAPIADGLQDLRRAVARAMYEYALRGLGEQP